MSYIPFILTLGNGLLYMYLKGMYHTQLMYFRHKPFNCDVTDWNEPRRKTSRSHSATLQNFQHTLPPTRDVGKHECARACACLAVRVTQREEQKKRWQWGIGRLTGGWWVGGWFLRRWFDWWCWEEIQFSSPGITHYRSFARYVEAFRDGDAGRLFRFFSCLCAPSRHNVRFFLVLGNCMIIDLKLLLHVRL